MIVKRGFSPLEGERILQIYPPMEQVSRTWQRRLRHFTGRTLTSPALEAEQQVRAGRLNLAGALTSPGVVGGFEAGIRREVIDDRPVFYLEIAPGLGVTGGGEPVFLANGIQIPLADVPGVGRVGDEPAPVGLRAGILVLIPAVELSAFPPDERTDSCEQDPANDAFADWQLVDAARLEFFRWPDEISLPPLPAAPADPLLWRNLLAAAIFNREQQLGPQDELPWESIGVPIALLALNPDDSPLFIDRSSVVRAGGFPNRRTDLRPFAGSRRLWQARLLQFSEQMGEIESSNLATADRVKTAAATIRYLPPVGLLPRDFIEFTWVDDRGSVVSTPFFPASVETEGVPVPLEQMDAVIESAASLAPFDLNTADELRMLVAVPQTYFDPRLLVAEVIDPAFQQTVDRAVARRGEMLFRRGEVRVKSTAVTQLITGLPQQFPDPDPDQLDPGEQALTALPEGTLSEIDYAGRAGGSTEIWAGHLTDLRNVLSPMLGAAGAAAEVDALSLKGIDETTRILDDRASRANDKIDMGFLRVQSDIYRVRQIALGTAQASRLSTSPAAATIVKAKTATATESKLDQAFKELKKNVVNPEVLVARNFSPVLLANVQNIADTGDTATGGIFTAADLSFSSLGSTVVSAKSSRLELLTSSGSGSSKSVVSKNPSPAQSASVVGAGKADQNQAAVSAGEVGAQSPIVGKGDNLTTTVGERLQSPQAVEAWLYAVSSLKEVVTSFQDPDLIGTFGSIEVAGIFDSIAGAQVQRKNLTVATVTADQILKERLSPDTKDEAAVFRESIDVMDRGIAVLRAAEGRVAALRMGIDICNRTRGSLATLLTEIGVRLEAITDLVNDARQDVSVATSLRSEEQLRLDTINASRRKVLDEHVAFVAYCRPRTNCAQRALPVRTIDPVITEAPIPTCLAQALAPPAELERYIEVLKESPVSWFPNIAALVDQLDTRERLLGVLDYARARSADKLPYFLDENAVTVSDGRFTSSMQSVLSAQRKVTAAYKNQLARLDMGGFQQFAWKDLRAQVRSIVSVADLIEAAGSRPAVLAAATKELHQTGAVGACLYAGFSQVLPALRLDWALRLSEYDAAVSLRNLNALPRFSELEYLDRHELQSYVDFLFSRVNDTDPDAVAAINDLVRIALLLASHAPVTRLITGRVTDAARVKEGETLDVSVDLAQVRRGLEVRFLKDGAITATGVIDDLLGERATVRVTKNYAQKDPLTLEALQIDKDARVQFVEPAAAKQSTPAKEIALGGKTRQQALFNVFGLKGK